MSGEDRTLDRPDGARLHYHVDPPAADSGPAVLFIHGLGSNWTRFRRLSQESVFRAYRRIIPDLRGHRDSTARRGIDVDGFVEDLNAILSQEGVSRAFVVGHCLGANIAARFWERHSSRVSGMVLIEPFVAERIPAVWRMLYAVARPGLLAVQALVLAANALGLRRRKFRRIDFAAYDEWVRPRLKNRFNVIRLMGPLLDLQCMPSASYLASFRVLFDYRPPWADIAAPVLVLMARQGGVLLRGGALNPFPRPNHAVVEIEASHFVLTDNREGVVRAIHTFLETLTKEPGWND